MPWIGGTQRMLADPTYACTNARTHAHTRTHAHNMQSNSVLQWIDMLVFFMLSLFNLKRSLHFSFSLSSGCQPQVSHCKHFVTVSSRFIGWKCLCVAVWNELSAFCSPSWGLWTQHNEGSVGTLNGFVCLAVLHVTAVESWEKISNAVIRAW